MTAQMTFGPGPFRVRTSPTGDMISLHLESQDWREAVTITRTRNELVDLVSQITVAITSHPPVPSDPDYLPDPEPRFEYGDLPVHDGLDDEPRVPLEVLDAMADDPTSCVTRIDPSAP
jgi:hypothetical protein